MPSHPVGTHHFSRLRSMQLKSLGTHEEEMESPAKARQEGEVRSKCECAQSSYIFAMS